MYNRIIALAVLFLISTFASFSQTAEEIVDKSIAATGGMDAYKNMKSSKMVAKMNASGMEFSMIMMAKSPAFRLEQEMMGQKMITVFDGKDGWMLTPQTPDAQSLPPEAIAGMREQANMTDNPLLKYKEPGAKIEKQGKEKVDGVTCNKIKLTDKDGKSVVMSIDADTYLIKKMSMDQGGTAVEISMQDYKKVGDFTVAHKYIIKAGEQNMDMTIQSMEFNLTLDDGLFKKPSSTPK